MVLPDFPFRTGDRGEMVLYPLKSFKTGYPGKKGMSEGMENKLAGYTHVPFFLKIMGIVPF
jgi:hypothetical protein